MELARRATPGQNYRRDSILRSQATGVQGYYGTRQLVDNGAGRPASWQDRLLAYNAVVGPGYFRASLLAGQAA